MGTYVKHVELELARARESWLEPELSSAHSSWLSSTGNASAEARQFFSRHFLCIFRVKHCTNMKISYILLLSYSNVTRPKMLQSSC